MKLHYFKVFLNFVIGLGVFILVIMFIRFNSIVADNAADTKHIVQSQNEILNAIKRQAVDNKISSEEKTAIIICMLQVNISERTTDVLNNCRKNALAGSNGITPAPSVQVTPVQPAQPTQPQTPGDRKSVV